MDLQYREQKVGEGKKENKGIKAGQTVFFTPVSCCYSRVCFSNVGVTLKPVQINKAANLTG